ncbi:testis-expressed protein 36 [Mugil cephalus]|uniref:testis-expressed protein 36 n=1 Tax=Mugil cephalus TaxID=48193 RepID=UPI001FB7D8EB|nr:testis-expressed protein 36 [Mugil cephalus]
MVKGGKHYSSSNAGKWFAHPGLPENETKTREACTSTGIMLTQVKSALPHAFNFERYPKRRAQQKSREYPFSDHDNKHTLKDNISIFSHGVGRRRFLDDRRQHDSHFCLCQDRDDSGTEVARGNLTAYQADFMVKEVVGVPTTTRRFTRNHKQKSAEALMARAGETFMWFGRSDSERSDTQMQVLAAANSSAASEP